MKTTNINLGAFLMLRGIEPVNVHVRAGSGLITLVYTDTDKLLEHTAEYGRDAAVPVRTFMAMRTRLKAMRRKKRKKK